MKLIIPGTLPGLNQYIAALDKSHYAGAALKKEAQLSSGRKESQGGS